MVDDPPRLPRRVPRIHERVSDREIVLYDPETEGVHALNPTAAAIWDLCDGSRTVDELARVLREHVEEEVEPEVVRSDVRRTLAEMADLGLIEPAPGADET